MASSSVRGCGVRLYFFSGTVYVYRSFRSFAIVVFFIVLTLRRSVDSPTLNCYPFT